MMKRILLVFCLGFTVFSWGNSASANLVDYANGIREEEESPSSGPNYFLVAAVALVGWGILRLMIRTPLSYYASKAMLALSVIFLGLGAINYVQKKIESFDLIAFLTGDRHRDRIR